MNLIVIYSILSALSLLLILYYSASEVIISAYKKDELTGLKGLNNAKKNRIMMILNRYETWILTSGAGRVLFIIIFTTSNILLLKNISVISAYLAAACISLPLIMFLSFIVPGLIVSRYYSLFVKKISPAVLALHLLFLPAGYAVLFIFRLCINLFNFKFHHENLAPEELGRVMSGMDGNLKLSKQESEILINVFNFGKKEASNIMYPRNQAVFIEYGSTVDEAMSIILENDIVRIPVIKNDPDNIAGIIDSRDMISSYLSNKNRKINKFIKPVDFFPFSKDLNELLKDFLKRKIQIAIIVDEYGGTSGVVTLNSILSALLGKDFGRWDNYKKDSVRITGGKDFIVYGDMQLDDFNTYFGLKLYSFNSDTIGGYVVEQLSSIPVKGDSIIIDNLELRIRSVAKRSIRTLEVAIMAGKRLL